MVRVSGVFTLTVFSALVMFVDRGSTQSLTQGELSSFLIDRFLILSYGI